MSGFEFNNLVFAMSGKSIVVRRRDRPDLPHFAISFKTASGQIDGHLKDELAPAGVYPYTPLFQFPASELRKFEADIAPKIECEFRTLLSQLKKTTPAWLRRRGYVLACIRSEVLLSKIPEFAPKRRGKHRVDLEKMKRLFTDPSQVIFFDPSALHSSELKTSADRVFAVRSSGRERMLGLLYSPSRYGSRVWHITNPAITVMQEIFLKIVPTDARDQIKDIWYKVHHALQLDELGIDRDPN